MNKYDPTGGHDARLARIQDENERTMHHVQEERNDRRDSPLCPLPQRPTWPPMVVAKEGSVKEGSVKEGQ